MIVSNVWLIVLLVQLQINVLYAILVTTTNKIGMDKEIIYVQIHVGKPISRMSIINYVSNVQFQIVKFVFQPLILDAYLVYLQ